MSNKTILQDHNTQLQQSNTKLAQAIEKVNELPNTGGGTVEMCTVTLTSTFAGVNTLIQGYADVFVLEEDFSVASENGSAFKHVGEFVEKSISVSVPKGSVIYASVSFDYLEYALDMPHEGYKYVTDTNHVSINRAALLLSLSDITSDGVFLAGDRIWGFAVYGDCEITFAPINTEILPEEGEQ